MVMLYKNVGFLTCVSAYATMVAKHTYRRLCEFNINFVDSDGGFDCFVWFAIIDRFVARGSWAGGLAIGVECRGGGLGALDWYIFGFATNGGTDCAGCDYGNLYWSNVNVDRIARPYGVAV